MALKDVKKYYYNVLNQLIAAKADLADFDQALKDGYITEDRVEVVKDEFNRIQENADRLAYIMYLFELPTKNNKKQVYIKQNKNLEELFRLKTATDEQILYENDSVLAFIRKELAKLKDTK